MLKLFGGRQIPFCRNPLSYSQCQSVKSLEYGLGQGASRYVGAGMRRGKQRATARERSAELTGNIKVTRHIHQGLVLADRVVRDKTRRARRACGLSEGGRGVKVTQRRADL